MPKTVQIPYDLFVDLVRFHLTDEPDEYGEIQDAIQVGLSRKLDALIRHDLYSTYKSDPDPARREAARIAYLDQTGIPASWRWKPGCDPNQLDPG